MLASLVLALVMSCNEEERRGVCTACCDPNGDKICKGDFSEDMCADYNKRKVDGYDWIFSEGLTTCPPPGPN